MTGADPWLTRLSALQDAVVSAEGMSEAAHESARVAIARVYEVHTEYSYLIARVQSFDGFWEDAEGVLDELPIALREGSEALHDWARRVLEKLRESVRHVIDYGEARMREVANNVERRIAGDLQSVATARTADRLEARSEELLEDISESAETARNASGRLGEDVLADYFKNYALEQKRSADVFRWVTIIFIVLAILAALFLPHDPAGGWTGAAARVSAIAAIGALGAYCGRQASQHRRLSDWAKTLQVQLLSLGAFIRPIDDVQSRADIYATFARRVLGSPPSRLRDEPAAADNSTPQLIELITALARRP